jgi:hypothetical protein
MSQKCGHPLAARQITVIATGPRKEDRQLKTTCWACAVEKETK